MKQKMMFCMLMLLMLSAASMNAQVTIGSTADPHAGAVLDLQSTTQGLKLPNVALNSDLTQFVLPENETSTPENATGMLVFNTNAEIGTGVYAWDGTKWNVVNTDNSEDANVGSTTAKIGNNTYKIHTYPDGVGTWMLENSKEGTASYKTYTGRAEGELGYYYTLAQASTACPNEWSLPYPDEWRRLATYLNANTLPSTWTYWLNWKILGGYRTTTIFTHWNSSALYWTSSANYLYISSEGKLERTADVSDGHTYLVRCIKK
jgi:uncharacterized protein (TIGR02145 family)